jgi:hypothetical protein
MIVALLLALVVWGARESMESETYNCWTIRQPWWDRVPPPVPEEDIGRRVWLALPFLTSFVITGTSAYWMTNWAVALGAAIIASGGLVLLIQHFRARKKRTQEQRRWEGWPEKYEFHPGTPPRSGDPLRGYVIKVPARDASTREWQDFLKEMRRLPEDAEVMMLMDRAEGILKLRRGKS